MKAENGCLIAAILLIVAFIGGLLFWVNDREDQFRVRCEAVGGHVRVVGNTVNSHICLTSDGRVIEIPGP